MNYDPKKDVIRMTVEELVQLTSVSGDFDLRSGSPKISPRSRNEESEIADFLKKNGSDHARIGVPLSITASSDGIMYEIIGKADCVIQDHERLILDDVLIIHRKKANTFLKEFRRKRALLLAHFLCTFRQNPEIILKFTDLEKETGNINFEEKCCSATALSDLFHQSLSQISYISKAVKKRVTERLPSVKSGKFPYASVREGQEVMIRECYDGIKHGERLFLQAPTGIGKTVSSLYPAVMALGAGYCDRIFYLTAKISNRREAFHAAAEIFSAGSKLRTVVLTSREQICPNRDACNDPAGVSGHCNPESCPRAKGFYDRLPAALSELLSPDLNGFPCKTVEEIANRHSLCPYEFQLELSRFCDIIICDYNYVFDPLVRLRRFFDEETEEKVALLVDEAHNLPDRAMRMFSADLSASELEKCLEIVPLNAVKTLLDFMKQCEYLCKNDEKTDENGINHGYYLNKTPISGLAEKISDARRSLEYWNALQEERNPTAWQFLSSLKKCETVLSYYDDHYLTFLETHGEEEKLRLICLDPSAALSEILKNVKSAIFFSATLTPLDYFSYLLGGGKNAVKVSLPSPFPKENLCLVAVSEIHTRFEEREKSYRKLVSLIASMISCKSGNYIVYFPSYDYMEHVFLAFFEKYPKIETIKQEPHMRKEAIKQFLDRFEDDGKLRVGFCVLGGSFSEGVDLPGNRLIGVMIIGVGLPGLSDERNLLREHYDQIGESGYDYAYTYPGMNRVLQAAGRVIRRESDRGIVVLADDRYAKEPYLSLFPEHWNRLQYANDAFELADIASVFWKNSKKSSDK